MIDDILYYINIYNWKNYIRVLSFSLFIKYLQIFLYYFNIKSKIMGNSYQNIK